MDLKGKKVIINQGSHATRIGTIESISARKQSLPSGIEALTAVISLGMDKRAVIPLDNLELIID